MNRGNFFVLEGIDCAGTTTQTGNLNQYLPTLKSYRERFIVTKEPTDETIKAKINENQDPYQKGLETANLFIGDSLDHNQSLLIPSLTSGIDVISDRYRVSTLAYQAAQGVPIEKLLDMHMQHQERLAQPDLTILLDIPAEVAMQRMKSREHRDLFEKKEFLKKVRDMYLKIAAWSQYSKPIRRLSGRMIVLDGKMDDKDVFRDVLNRITIYKTTHPIN